MWFTIIGVVAVVLLVVLGLAMLMRFVLRRRIARASAQLPDSDFTGTALLAGTNFDDSLRGIGALAVTRDSVVFVAGSDQHPLHMPRADLTASGYRRERQRKPSLRIQWGANIAQFEVTQPSVAEWVERLKDPK